MQPSADDLLRRQRELTAQVRGNVYPNLGAVDELCSVASQLDDLMTEGGIPPRQWWPPLQHDNDQRLISERRALTRLEAVMDRAILDDERADKALMPAMPAVLGAQADPKFREYLVRVLARAVVDELHREQDEMRAMLARMARNQTLRIQEQVVRSRATPRPGRIAVAEDGKFRIGPLGEQPPLPDSLRRPQT